MTPKPFDFDVPKVLPTVYDDALSYYEVLCNLMYRIEELEKSDLKPLYSHTIILSESGLVVIFTLFLRTGDAITKDTLKDYMEKDKEYTASGSNSNNRPVRSVIRVDDTIQYCIYTAQYNFTNWNNLQFTDYVVEI